MPSFNALVGGFERKKLVVVGSRPSEGKSAFCLQQAYEFSKKFKVLYLSLEMTIEEAMFRLLCYQHDVPNTSFYRGEHSFDYNNLMKDFEESVITDNRKLIISEDIGRTWDQIEKVLADLRDDPPDIVMLDYIQCIKTQGKSLENINDYIKKFRKMAIDMNFCLFLCSQINRQNIADNKEPTMEGLQGTSFLETHADVVILLYYPCKRSPDKDTSDYKIIVSKNKNGMTRYINCHIKPETYRIYEIEEKKDETERQQEISQTDWTD